MPSFRLPVAGGYINVSRFVDQSSPYCFLRNGVHQGFEKQIVYCFSVYLDRPFVYRDYTAFKDLFSNLVSGKIAVGLGIMVITEGRKRTLEFSNAYLELRFF